MDNPDENRILPLFCLLDILFTRGHHGLPGFPPVHWLDFPNEWDWLQYMCITEEWGCLTVPEEVRSEVFNRVFSRKDSGGRTVWVNMHGDPNFFVPDNPKEAPSLRMLTGQVVRQQLINILNKQRWTSYNYVDFKAIQKDLCETYGLLYELSVWVLPSLNHPNAWVRDDNSPAPFWNLGRSLGLHWKDMATIVAWFNKIYSRMNMRFGHLFLNFKQVEGTDINYQIWVLRPPSSEQQRSMKICSIETLSNLITRELDVFMRHWKSLAERRVWLSFLIYCQVEA